MQPDASTDTPEISSATVHRSARAADHALIYSTWLSSMKESMVETRGRSPDAAVRVAPDVFYAGQHRRIERLLSDPATRILLCALVADLDVALGWAIARGDCLHYVFVKPAWRRRGIARGLVQTLANGRFNRYSVHTRPGDSFVVPMMPGAVYDPFAVDTESAHDGA